MTGLVDLQKVLDRRPKPTDSEFAVKIDAITFHKGIDKTTWEKAENEWYQDLKSLFASFRVEYDNQVVKERSLRKQFKDLIDIIPLDMEKVGENYEVYSIGSKNQWVEWFLRYNQILHGLTVPGTVIVKCKPFLDRKQLEDQIELLSEVVEKKGAYSQDHLQHAENVIENASERAGKVTAFLKELFLGSEETK